MVDAEKICYFEGLVYVIKAVESSARWKLREVQRIWKKSYEALQTTIHDAVEAAVATFNSKHNDGSLAKRSSSTEL